VYILLLRERFLCFDIGTESQLHLTYPFSKLLPSAVSNLSHRRAVMASYTASTQVHKAPRERQTICSRLRRRFRGPPKESRAAKLGKLPESERQDLDVSEKGSGPYQHIPTAAQSSFLRTTTKRDMFELTGNGKQLASGEASVVASVEDLGAQSTENRPALGVRSESRLRHTEASGSSDKAAER
jgi:hypothetical protein